LGKEYLRVLTVRCYILACTASPITKTTPIFTHVPVFSYLFIN
jgi:hypothetical protein